MAIKNFQNSSDSQDQTGFGNKHGQIASPLQPCPYDATPNGGQGVMGGENVPPFDRFNQTPNSIMTKIKDGLQGNQSTDGKISTPLDGTTSIGATGQASGSGSKQGDISSPWGSSPWGWIGNKG